MRSTAQPKFTAVGRAVRTSPGGLLQLREKNAPRSAVSMSRAARAIAYAAVTPMAGAPRTRISRMAAAAPCVAGHLYGDFLGGQFRVWSSKYRLAVRPSGWA